MVKKAFRIIALLLAISLLLPGTAFAATNASKYISNYGGSCYRANNTTVQVYFDISAKYYIDQLGATEIKLYESSDLNTWSLVKIFTYTAYSNMMAYNDYTIDSHVDYSNARSDRYYKAVITFIAVSGSETEYRTLYTPSI